MGLSGGLDSSVTLALAKEAVGDKVKVLIMPDPEVTPEEDVEDALLYVKSLGVDYKIIDISPIVKAYSELLPYDTLALGNLRARIRMSLLYYYANLEGRKVLGAGDKSELLIGYFTKYGDGAADFFPIAHLYKTQVRKLSEYLGIPSGISFKPSSPQLYPGHKLLDEIPIDYDELDPVLVGLFERELSPNEISEETGVPLKIVLDIKSRFEKTRHKRELPPRIIRLTSKKDSSLHD